MLHEVPIFGPYDLIIVESILALPYYHKINNPSIRSHERGTYVTKIPSHTLETWLSSFRLPRRSRRFPNRNKMSKRNRFKRQMVVVNGQEKACVSQIAKSKKLAGLGADLFAFWDN